MKNKLLAFCDSPTCESGFGRVASNLLTRWQQSGFFEQIWVWAIGYAGFPVETPLKLCPAATAAFPVWHSVENLERFLLSLDNEKVGGTDGGFTHIFLMHDTWVMSPMAQILRKKASDNSIKTLLYYPVDAPLKPEWTDIVAAVDVPVAYCEYGIAESRKAMSIQGKDSDANTRRRKAIPRLRSLPHGVDRRVYKPFDLFEGGNTKEVARKTMFGNVVTDEDFLICVVSMNQKRKGHHLALQVFKLLLEQWPEMRPKLYMHCAMDNVPDGISLDEVANDLGLKVGRDVFFARPDLFPNGHPLATEQQLNSIYNACDLLLTTTYGEGWGLTITEAMAAGLPVAGPNHTSVANILGSDLPHPEQRGIIFETETFEVLPGDHGRLRPRADIQSAAVAIAGAWQSEKEDPEGPMSLSSYRSRALEWISGTEYQWDTIAEEWLKLMATRS